MEVMNQLRLLASRRFSGFLGAQFLGSFGDDLFRNALMVAVASRSVSVASMSTQTTIALSVALFMAPQLLFTPLAGQLGDKLSKSRLIVGLAAIELVVVFMAAVGFWLDLLPVLLTALFFMGLQSALFDATKYSIIPELTGRRALTAGNGLVVATMFLGILLGTVAGGTFGQGRLELVTVAALTAAALGLLASLTIPRTSPVDPGRSIDLNPWTSARDMARAVSADRTLFLSALGIAWLWFLGGSFLTLIPSYGSDVLGGDKELVALFVLVFCVGVAAGALPCNGLGGNKLELGLVPLGSIGLTIACFDLYFATEAFHPVDGRFPGARELLNTPGSTRVLVDFFVLAAFGGLFSVPLHALLQDRAPDKSRSTVIAGSNFMSALFTVASSLMLLALPRLGVTVSQSFLLLAIMSAAVSVYIYSVVPEFLLRFIAWLLAHTMYRIKVTGAEYLPEEGPAIIAANHVTYVDWLVISSVYQRPLRFVMHQQFLKLPLVGWAFRDAKVIPIASGRENPDVLARSFERIGEELEDGNVVCVFPEGALTRDGKLGPLKPGILKMLETHPVPVVPMRLDGFWGSFFSHKDGQALHRPFRRIWSRVSITIYPPLAPDEVTLEALQAKLEPVSGRAQ
jgi:1-acyl-sn-glycerol-3-phosphate acyltransferase